MPAAAPIEPDARQIADRKATADHVADWMHANCPSWSIDTLLTWPDRATAMGRWVCRRLGRRATPQNVHAVCRAALSSRKRGDLKRDRV